MIYEEYSIQNKIDEILDKISKYGISSLTSHEKEFLDAYSTGDEKFTKDKMQELYKDIVLEDSYFKFELEDKKENVNDIEYTGTLYVPDLEFLDGHKIEGDLKGKLIVYKNGTYSLEFTKLVYEKDKEVEYDVFEFCNGLEYELDSFIDYVISELE
jgi:hypothetical protein